MPGSPGASLNDFVFDRMIRNRWTIEQIRAVDKQYAKFSAKALCPDIRVPETVSIIRLNDRVTADSFIRHITPFLGQRLVAKPTHGSGVVVFLDDPDAINQLQRLYECARKDFFGEKRETQYTYLERKVIVEENVSDTCVAPLDYKFFCFGGVPEFCQVDVGRFENHSRAIFDVRSETESVIRIGPYPRAPNVVLPENFSEMALAAQALAKPFDIVRIDLYSVAGSIYFSEFTFSPHAAVMKVENDADVVGMVGNVANGIAPLPLIYNRPVEKRSAA